MIFESDPVRYVPAYGGYCAFGVSVGKKFVGDPDVWKIVDGKLYLNLDTKIQEKWSEDIPGNNEKADRNWKEIKHKDPLEMGLGPKFGQRDTDFIRISRSFLRCLRGML